MLRPRCLGLSRELIGSRLDVSREEDGAANEPVGLRRGSLGDFCLHSVSVGYHSPLPYPLIGCTCVKPSNRVLC